MCVCTEEAEEDAEDEDDEQTVIDGVDGHEISKLMDNTEIHKVEEGQQQFYLLFMHLCNVYTGKEGVGGGWGLALTISIFTYKYIVLVHCMCLVVNSPPHGYCSNLLQYRQDVT